MTAVHSPIADDRLGAVLIDIDRTILDDVLNTHIALCLALMKHGMSIDDAIAVTDQAGKNIKGCMSSRGLADFAIQKGLPGYFCMTAFTNPWDVLTADKNNLFDKLLRDVTFGAGASRVSPSGWMRSNAILSLGPEREVIEKTVIYARTEALESAMDSCGVSRRYNLSGIFRDAAAFRKNTETQEFMPHADAVLLELWLSKTPIIAVTNAWATWQRAKASLIEAMMRRRHGIDFRFTEIHTFGDGVSQQVSKPHEIAAMVALDGSPLLGGIIGVLGDSLTSDLLLGLRSNGYIFVRPDGTARSKRNIPPGPDDNMLVFDAALYDTEQEAISFDTVERKLREVIERGWEYSEERGSEILSGRRDVIRDLRDFLLFLRGWEPASRDMDRDGRSHGLRASFQHKGLAAPLVEVPNVCVSKAALDPTPGRVVKTGDISRRWFEWSELNVVREQVLKRRGAISRSRLHRMLHDNHAAVARYLFSPQSNEVLRQHVRGIPLDQIPQLTERHGEWVANRVTDFLIDQFRIDPYPLLSSRRPLPHRRFGTSRDRFPASRLTFAERMVTCSRRYGRHRNVLDSLLQSTDSPSLMVLLRQVEAEQVDLHSRRLTIVQDTIEPARIWFVPSQTSRPLRPDNARAPLIFDVSERAHIGDPLEEIASVAIDWPGMTPYIDMMLSRVVETYPEFGSLDVARSDLDLLIKLGLVELTIDRVVTYAGEVDPSSESTDTLLRTFTLLSDHFGVHPAASVDIASWHAMQCRENAAQLQYGL